MAGGPSVATSPRATRILQMSEHGQAGGAREPWIDPDIDGPHELRNVGLPAAQRCEDRRLAGVPVGDILPDEAWGFADRPAMARQIDLLVAPQQLVERGHVIGHRAVGRSDDRRVPRHHVIAGEQKTGFPQGEGHVVRGMPRGRDRLDRKALAPDDLAVGERMVGNKIVVGACFEPVRFADMQRARGAVRPLRERHRPGRRLDLRRARRMIDMGMGDENMRHAFVADGIEQRRNVLRIVRPWIDDCDLAAADDVTDRALEGERTWIIAQEPAHAGRNLLHAAGREVEAPVEGDVVGHAPNFAFE